MSVSRKRVLGSSARSARLIARACNFEALESRTLFSLPGVLAPTHITGSRISAASGSQGGQAESIAESTGGVRYADGTLDFAATDLSSDGFGFGWGLTRHWTNNGDYIATGSPSVGNNWVIAEVPQVLQQSGDGYVMIDGTDARYYDRSNSGTTPERYSGRVALNTETLTHATVGSKDVLVMRDGGGNRISFYSFSSTNVTNGVAGKFLSLIDGAAGPAGDGNKVEATYSSSGELTELQRTLRQVSGSAQNGWIESYQFSYSGSYVTQITLRRSTNAGTDWSTLRTVQYDRYGSSDTSGRVGDLKAVRILDDAGHLVDANYYRYFNSAGNGTTGGYDGGLKLAFDSHSYARLSKAYDNGGFLTQTDATIAPYALQQYGYDSISHRVTSSIVQREGTSSGSGAGRGSYSYTYASNSNTPGSTDVNFWTSKTTETTPDGNTEIVYSNQFGQRMLGVHLDGTTGGKWGTFYNYRSDGRLTFLAHPSALQLPSSLTTIEAYNDLLHSTSSNHFQYVNDSAGLIDWTTYGATTTAAVNSPGDVLGWTSGSAVSRGDTTAPVVASTVEYLGVAGTSTDGSGALIFADGTPAASSFLLGRTTIAQSGGNDSSVTYAYTFDDLSGHDNHLLRVDVTLPDVDTSRNGNGSLNRSILRTGFDPYGMPAWSTSARGTTSYTTFDMKTGAVTAKVDDVYAGHDAVPSSPPAEFSSGSVTSIRAATSLTNDDFGRVTSLTDPDGKISYVVYRDAYTDADADGYYDVGSDDFSREIRVYSGWTGTSATGPTRVARIDRANGYVETLTMAAAPSAPGGIPTGEESISGVKSLDRQFISPGGQLIEDDKYFDLVGVSYTTGSLGTVNTNFYRSTYAYDDGGRLQLTVGPTGTYNKTIYDSLGRPTATYVGTSSSNLISTTASVYDAGGVGDGTLTALTRYPHDGSANRLIEMAYDWRDRLVTTKGGAESGTESATTNRQIVYQALDTAGNVIVKERFDGDGLAITTDTSPADGVPDEPTGTIVAKQTTDYDQRGRAYELRTYSVSGGTVAADYLRAGIWYDKDGQIIKLSAPGGGVQKTHFDALGRPDINAVTDGAADGSSYANASTLSDDHVIIQHFNTHSPGGGLTWVRRAEREPMSTRTGDLLPYDSGLATSPPSVVSDHNSFTSYSYDNAHRLVQLADLGDAFESQLSRTLPVTLDRSKTLASTDGSISNNNFTHTYKFTPTSLPTMVPDEYAGYTATVTAGGVSAKYIITGNTATYFTFPHALATGSSPHIVVDTSGAKLTDYNYDSAGDVGSSVDPVGQESRITYDARHRRTKIVSNYVNGTMETSDGSQADDKTTSWEYDGNDNVTLLRAALSSGSYQDTAYVYDTSAVAGSSLHTHDLLTAIQYADKSSGSASSTEEEHYTYNAQGDQTTYLDRNGTTHSYAYDVAGRLTTDNVTGSLGSGVDGAITKLGYAYGANGLGYTYTSYGATGSPVNQVEELYNGYGQMTTEYQEHAGSVDLNSKQVQYAFGHSTANTNTSRLTSITYPNGRIVRYQYGNFVAGYTQPEVGQPAPYNDAASNGINDAISRVSYLADDSSGSIGTHLEEYSYLGLRGVVGKLRPEDSTAMRLHDPTTAVTDGLTGIDHFGRIADLDWQTVDATDFHAIGHNDQFKYGYDFNDNVLYRTNEVEATHSFDELYAYDGLDRLTSMKRGTLDATHTAISGTVARQQQWTLDAQANVTTLTTDGVSASASFNKQNQSTSHTFDNSGNDKSLGVANATYDAWNRLTDVPLGTGTNNIHGMKYTYDALGRRIIEAGYGSVAVGTEIEILVADESVTTDLYYSNRWQVLEEDARKPYFDGTIEPALSGTITGQATYVWSPFYVDELVLRDKASGFVANEEEGGEIEGGGLEGGSSTNGGGGGLPTMPIPFVNGSVIDAPDGRVYVQQDANYNVTSLVGDTDNGTSGYQWGVVERYAYDAYGDPTFLDSAFAPTSGSTGAYSFTVLHHGSSFDPNTRVYHVRNRVLANGTWVQTDPLQIGTNLYAAFASSPITCLDPDGLVIHVVPLPNGDGTRAATDEQVDKVKKAYDAAKNRKDRNGNFTKAALALQELDKWEGEYRVRVGEISGPTPTNTDWKSDKLIITEWTTSDVDCVQPDESGQPPPNEATAAHEGSHAQRLRDDPSLRDTQDPAKVAAEEQRATGDENQHRAAMDEQGEHVKQRPTYHNGPADELPVPTWDDSVTPHKGPTTRK